MKRIKTILKGFQLLGWYMLTPFSERMRWRILIEQELIKLNLRPTPPQPKTEHYILIDSLEFISVADFIECSVNDKLELLVVDGDPPPDIVDQTWLTLVDQYQDSIKSESSENYIDVSRQILKLEVRLKRVEWLCHTMELAFNSNTPIDQSKEVVIKASDELRGYGYAYGFTDNTYAENIERIRTGEKRHESIRDRLKKSIKDSKKEGKKKATADDFYNVIETLRSHHKYTDSPTVLAKQWSMKDYGLLLTRYNKDVEKENTRLALLKAKNKYGTKKG